MTLWIRVSDDKYELPIAVADTAAELARMCGVDRRTIASMLCLVRQGKYKNSIYQEVEIDDE